MLSVLYFHCYTGVLQGYTEAYKIIKHDRDKRNREKPLNTLPMLSGPSRYEIACNCPWLRMPPLRDLLSEALID
jgi:hypothetical protein